MVSYHSFAVDASSITVVYKTGSIASLSKITLQAISVGALYKDKLIVSRR